MEFGGFDETVNNVRVDAIRRAAAAEKSEQRAGGAAVMTIGEGKKQRSDDAEDEDGNGSDADDFPHVGIEGFNGVQVHREAGHGGEEDEREQDLGDEVQHSECAWPRFELPRQTACEKLLKRTMRADVVAIQLPPGEYGREESYDSQQQQPRRTAPRCAASCPSSEERL